MTGSQVEPALVHVEQIERQHPLVGADFVDCGAEPIAELLGIEARDEGYPRLHCFHGFVCLYAYLDV